MKKKFAFTLCLLATAIYGIAQQASKELAKSFSAKDAVEVVLALPSEPEIVIWEKDHIAITVNITLANFSQGILNELARVGRYDLTSTTENEVLTISAASALSKSIQIRGQDFVENMHYTVFVPANTPVQVSGNLQKVMAMRK